jgi:hypothetical protein
MAAARTSDYLTQLSTEKRGRFENQSSADDQLAGELIRDYQYLFGLRGNWNSHWTEIAQRIFPMESYLFQNLSQLNSQGDKRNFEVYDSTGVLALQRFGAILDSLLTPRDQFWHNIKPSDDYLLKDKRTRLWYERANNLLFEARYAPGANFSAQNQGQYLSLGAYGTGVLFIDKLAGAKALRYRHVHLGENYLQENHQGLIDRNCRRFMLTAHQAYGMFGENCPEKILAIKNRAPETQFFFLHWCKPNAERDPERRDYKGMSYASHYVSLEGQKICRLPGREGDGYTTFPYAISRYYQCANEAYGRSIAMDVLPSLKTLNEQKKTMLKQGHRVVDPVLLAHDDGVLDGFSLQPGALNPGGVSAEGRLLVQPLPTGNISAGKEVMDDERTLINDSFLISLFQVLTENPQMSATEVLERTREKGILLAPTIGRQQSEYLGPMIDRELDLLSHMGKLPPQTPAMREAQGNYKTEYDSPITRTMKAEWAAGAQRTVQTLMELAQATQDPSYLYYIDFDIAAPIIASINGTPPSWIRSKEDVQKLKQMLAQQKQQEQVVAAAPAVAGVVKAHAQAQAAQPAPAQG